MAARHFADIGEREKVYKLKVKIKQAFRRAQETGEYKTISTTQSIKTSDLENETRDFFGVSISDTFNLFTINEQKCFHCFSKNKKETLCFLLWYKISLPQPIHPKEEANVS